MDEFLTAHFEWIRALHIISVMAWMAGMLYLPRLFVYHADVPKGSEMSETFKIMERRLLKIIINPAMIAAWVFGLLMLYSNWAVYKSEGWMHTKLLLVFLLSGVHGVLAKRVKVFARDENEKSARYFRILNEVPTIMMIIIVILAVVEPF
ncbi:MAG: protoporphyrinogen oxidase HemJ [Alphaproteobacteria bacterium]|nr:protoporphyrinogen oxidase HemJ [Alphaproteobacteria bacterium]